MTRGVVDERTRGQSNVVGVALLMGITVVAMAGLTVGIGAVVEHTAADADAERVASQLSSAIAPVTTTGRHSGRVSFTSGRLRTVERDLRVRNASGTQWRVETGGLVFESGDRRVAYVAGAVTRATGDSAWLEQPPPITAPREGAVLVVSAPRLNASDVAVSGDGGTDALLRTRVTHQRIPLGNGTFSVAVETRRPAPLVRYFRDRNATVTHRDFDGDGIESVVARFHGDRVGYLVVHDVHLEVSRG